MQNSKKITTRIAIFLFSMLLFVGPVYAGLMSSAGVKKAQEFVDAGRKDGAINALNDWLNKNPKDDDAYWMLANLYMQKGEYDRAEEQFGYFLNLRSGKQGVVTDKFKEAFRHEVASGSLYKAKSLAQKLIGFQSTYRQQVYASFYAKGKSSFGQIAVDNFDAALLFANNQGEREKIGKNFLKIALEDSHFGYLVEKAVNILGKDFVNQVMPSQNDEIIFSHTYTDADIGPDGKVIVLDYAKTLLMPGDVLNINTIMPRGGGSIKIFHSDKEQGEIPERGKYRCEYEKSDKVDKGNVSVLFAKGHNTNISVDVVRNVKKKADFTRLSNL